MFNFTFIKNLFTKKRINMLKQGDITQIETRLSEIEKIIQRGEDSDNAVFRALCQSFGDSVEATKVPLGKVKDKFKELNKLNKFGDME